MSTALRATQPRIGSHVPAPMELFRVTLPDGVHIPQLAIDRLVVQLATDPKAFAEAFLSLLYLAKATDYAVGRQRQAADERAAGNPSLAKINDQRLSDALKRIDAIEDRIGGRAGQGVEHENALERMREDISYLMGCAS